MGKNIFQINGGITINIDVSVKNLECLYLQLQKWKIFSKYYDDSVITCDEIIEEKAKAVTANFNEKNAICKTKKLNILLVFLLITIALLQLLVFTII